MTATNPSTTAQPARTRGERLALLFGIRGLDILVATLALLLIVLFFWPRIVVTVHSGEAGVVWRSYAGGTDVKRIYGEGLHFIAPWNEFFIYQVRLQELTRNYEVLSKDGLHLQVLVSARFRPKGAPFPWHQSKPNALAQLHKSVGPDYVKVVLIPDISSALRRVMDSYEGDVIYLEREGVEKQIFEVARTRLDNRYIDLDALVVERIVFPQGVRASIEAKLVEEQANLRYEYTLAKEEQEAERKRIEAVGVRDFQRTVAEGLTEQYLRWKAIEAMVQIAKSNNSKVIIVGGKDGVPVIVNSGNETPTTTATPPPGPAPGVTPVPQPTIPPSPP